MQETNIIHETAAYWQADYSMLDFGFPIAEFSESSIV